MSKHSRQNGKQSLQQIVFDTVHNKMFCHSRECTVHLGPNPDPRLVLDSSPGLDQGQGQGQGQNRVWNQPESGSRSVEGQGQGRSADLTSTLRSECGYESRSDSDTDLDPDLGSRPINSVFNGQFTDGPGLTSFSLPKFGLPPKTNPLASTLLTHHWTLSHHLSLFDIGTTQRIIDNRCRSNLVTTDLLSLEVLFN